MSTSTHIAFVRAVMLGREGLHRDVLVGLFERAGGTRVVSHLTTGNVSFDVGDDQLAGMVADVGDALERLLGRPTPVFVRSLDALGRLLAADPFANEPFDDVYARLVTFFRDRVPHTMTVPMRAPNGDWAVFGAGDAEVFSVTRARPDRQPQDPGGVIQRTAGQLVTTRGLGTIERIVTKLR
jgi:uncharacterized protein (DUF1697 family)